MANQSFNATKSLATLCTFAIIVNFLTLKKRYEDI